MDFKSNKIDISYPLELAESMNSFPPKHVVPCSALINNEEIGGIFIVCPSLEIKYFNIVPTSPPEPPLKFRMLNFESRIFVIEIWMEFSRNPEKYLKMHLNPHDLSVRKLIRLVTETKLISFHFYDIKSKLLSTAITGLSDEEADWFDRNNKLVNKLISDRHEFEVLSNFLKNKITSTDRFFKYFNQGKSDFFVRDGGIQVVMGEISKTK
jgi:hypothetical protein